MPQLLVASSHQVDHIIAEKHGGATSEVNLALTCSLCNLRKGSDIASLDPETGELTRLFNPRDQSWRRRAQGAAARRKSARSEEAQEGLMQS